ncbi:MAG: hypothetical protein ACRC33_09100 [Gemmataceae bacterium]
MDVMIPMVLPVAAESGDLVARVRRLEHALALSLEVTQLLIERLEAKLGPGFVGEELGRVSGGGDVRSDVARIDDLVRHGKQAEAARHFRELAGVTWDEAHNAIRRWQPASLETTIRSIQVAKWLRVLSGAIAAAAAPG